LHHRRTSRFKTSQLDLFLSFPLQRFHNTQVALLSRMLERGTMRHPSLRALNAYVDSLYGASYSSSVGKFGPRQVIHLNMELVSSRFVPGSCDQLLAGIDFFSEILCEPRVEEGGFPATSLDQEKTALRQTITNLFSDKLALARSRCIEEMCRDEPCGLPALGDPNDFERIDAESLLSFHRRLVTVNRISLYVTDNQSLEEVAAICRDRFAWMAAGGSVVASEVVGGHLDGGALGITGFSQVSLPRRISEFQEVQQGRIILGYRTPVRFADQHYPALLLLNQVLGGDANSRLYRRLREEAGLCYHSESFIEPSCGLLFVEASVDSADCDATISLIEAEMTEIATDPLGEGELEQSRLSLINRLEAMDEDRSALVSFNYTRILDSLNTSRVDLRRELEDVSAEDVMQVARQLVHDTRYTLQSQKDREPYA